jgi:molecular chaperone DnaJ
MTDYYKTLNVNKDATFEEIKNSYKQLAKQNHPDKGGSTEKFQEIQTAYETLSDQNKRNEYDNRNNPQFQQQHFQQHFQQNFPGNININGFGGFPFNFFNVNQNQNQTVKKNDEIYNFVITLKDVYFGSKKNFQIKRKYNCENCNLACGNCNGLGFDKNNQRIQLGPFFHIQNQVCSQCNGSGLTRIQICVQCNNSGIKIKEKNFDLFIPKGVESGKRYTYETWGEQASKKHELPGDFIIVINIEDNQFFKRNGLDLIYHTNISLKYSIIGKEITIPYFDEDIVFNTKKISIIDPKKEYVIQNKGLRNELGNVGNLILKFKINYPNRYLNEEEISSLQKTFSSINI